MTTKALTDISVLEQVCASQSSVNSLLFKIECEVGELLIRLRGYGPAIEDGQQCADHPNDGVLNHMLSVGDQSESNAGRILADLQTLRSLL